jgi:hypothetical protein
LIIVIILPKNPNIGVLPIYLTIAVLSKIGLPVFLNSYSGWGLPTPNWIGWSLGILFWIIFYLSISYVITHKIKPSK